MDAIDHQEDECVSFASFQAPVGPPPLTDVPSVFLCRGRGESTGGGRGRGCLLRRVVWVYIRPRGVISTTVSRLLLRTALRTVFSAHCGVCCVCAGCGDRAQWKVVCP